MFYLFLAKQFIRTQWRSQNEYRFSFIMGILAQGPNFVFRYLALFGFKVWISQRMEFSRITSDLFFLTIHIRNRFNIYT